MRASFVIMLLCLFTSMVSVGWTSWFLLMIWITLLLLDYVNWKFEKASDNSGYAKENGGNQNG